MRIRSKDTHGTGYRFILAAAYTRPKFPDQEDPPEPKEEDMASATYDFSDLDLDELPAEELVQDKEVLFPNNEETGELGSYMDEQMEELGLNEELLSPELKALKAGDKLWDDDERAADEQAANAAEEEPLEGNHEVPVDFLYFVRKKLCSS